MQVTYKELKATFPDEKKAIESLYGRIFPVRKISYLVTIPLLRMDVTPFAVSVSSIAVAMAACLMLSLPLAWARVTGIVLAVLWHILDCVDGNIARYTKKASRMGEAVDAICGYFILSFLCMALGIASYNIGENYLGISPHWFLIFGGVASVSVTLSRLIHQKYAFQAKMAEDEMKIYIEKGEHRYSLTGFHKLRGFIDANMGPVGIPMFVLWLSPFFNLYHILAVYYCAFNVLSLVVLTYYYLRQCKKTDALLNAAREKVVADTKENK